MILPHELSPRLRPSQRDLVGRFDRLERLAHVDHFGDGVRRRRTRRSRFVAVRRSVR